jgi:hypothetical protein
MDYVSVLEKITFDADGKPEEWFWSRDDGKTWETIDCSMYPDGRPPFVIFNQSPKLAYMMQQHFEPKES